MHMNLFKSEHGLELELRQGHGHGHGLEYMTDHRP